jgi:tetratricopeptide (TPR) repeat protein
MQRDKNTKDVEKILERALHIAGTELEDSVNVETASVLNGLADYYLKIGDPDMKAEGLLKRCLSINELILPAGHPNIGSALNTLSRVMSAQKRYKEAEVYSKRSLQIVEDIYGSDHPNISTVLNSLGQLLLEQDRFDEAIVCF